MLAHSALRGVKHFGYGWLTKKALCPKKCLFSNDCNDDLVNFANTILSFVIIRG